MFLRGKRDWTVNLILILVLVLVLVLALALALIQGIGKVS